MDSVKDNRDKYIGGSDLPAIMGISSFKTRWELLQEKAGIKRNTFEGNKYTAYGNVLEPQIRDYINSLYKTEYKPDVVITGDLRGNTDGYDGQSILEIKTTSQIHESVDEYKAYLVQLLFYMKLYGASKGLLAVYERPEDFNGDFDSTRLQLMPISQAEYTELLDEISAQIERFRYDLERLRDDPFLSEEDLTPKEIVELAGVVEMLHADIVKYKRLTDQYDELRNELKEQMDKYHIKSWTLDSGMKITCTKDTEDKTAEVFDEKAFKNDCPELYERYKKTQIKKGRKGYVSITVGNEQSK